jgi:hypothetical protein
MHNKVQCSICGEPANPNCNLAGEPCCLSCSNRSKKATIALAIAFDSTAPFCPGANFTEGEREILHKAGQLLTRLIDVETVKSVFDEDETLYKAIEEFINNA